MCVCPGIQVDGGRILIVPFVSIVWVLMKYCVGECKLHWIGEQLFFVLVSCFCLCCSLMLLLLLPPAPRTRYFVSAVGLDYDVRRD